MGKVVQCCCEGPNPIFQFLYLSCVVGGYITFIVVAFPFIPGPFIAGYHKTLSIFAVAWTLFSFIYCSFSDPGLITKTNLRLYREQFPFDNVLYHKRRCETCDIDRPPRAKHCNVCGGCVARFDHHCIWINNCVGANNHAKFIIFLLSTALLATYSSWGLVAVVRGIIEEKGLWTMVIRNNITGRMSPLPWGAFINILVSEGGGCLALGVFSGVLALVLYGFTFYQVYLVVKNTTTYETFKRSDLRSDVKAARLITKRIQEMRKEEKAKKKPTEDEEIEGIDEVKELLRFGRFASFGIVRKVWMKTGVDVKAFSLGSEKMVKDMAEKKRREKEEGSLPAKTENDGEKRGLRIKLPKDSNHRRQQERQRNEPQNKRKGDKAEEEEEDQIVSAAEVNKAFLAEVQRLLTVDQTNIYHRGVLQNLAEIFSSSSSASSSSPSSSSSSSAQTKKKRT
ncbi:putative palmitoyltransferase zdhhc4 [Balamuthia mandrillaris]